MDFAFTEEQEALRDLARKILGDHTAHDRLKEIEKGPDWFDHEPCPRRSVGAASDSSSSACSSRKSGAQWRPFRCGRRFSSAPFP